jgi:hypothetical protein
MVADGESGTTKTIRSSGHDALCRVLNGDGVFIAGMRHIRFLRQRLDGAVGVLDSYAADRTLCWFFTGNDWGSDYLKMPASWLKRISLELTNQLDFS